MTQDGRRRNCKPLLVNLARTTVLLAALLAGYVASFGATCWYYHSNYSGRIGERNCRMLFDSIFVPLVSYSKSELPGGKLLYSFAGWCSEVAQR
jgi:hypothetical protein